MMQVHHKPQLDQNAAQALLQKRWPQAITSFEALVAGAYYWRDHLMCMAVQSRYYEQQLASLPNYRARIDCYQLRASLVEMYVQARRKEQSKLEWHIKRCQELLDNVSS
jgi:hypothetical protein